MKNIGKTTYYFVKGWYQTIFYAAPESEEDVATIHDETAENTQELLKSYHELRKLTIKRNTHDYQIPSDGVGDLYCRTYSVDFKSAISCEEIASKIWTNPDQFAVIHESIGAKEPSAGHSEPLSTCVG